MRSSAGKPPALPPPPQPASAAGSAPAAPASNQPPGQPVNEAGAGPDRAPARLAAERRRRPVHRLRRQSRSVRAFPPMEPVAGQGDDPDRAAAFGPLAARAQLRRARRRAPVRRSRAARRGGAVPRLEPGPGQRPAADHGRRRGAARLDAAAARPQDPAGGYSGGSDRAIPTMRCSRR